MVDKKNCVNYNPYLSFSIVISNRAFKSWVKTNKLSTEKYFTSKEIKKSFHLTLFFAFFKVSLYTIFLFRTFFFFEREWENL